MKMTYLLRRCIRHFFIGISSVSTRFIPVILIAVVIAASPVLAEDKAKLSTIVPKDLGDGGQIEDAWLGGLKDLVIDDEGNLYFPDLVFSVVLKLTPSGQVIRIAGTGVGGFSGDNGPATEAQLNEPYSLALDPDGILYISDFGNNRVRAVNLSPNPLNQIPPGFIVTVAGNGDFGYSGDDGLATAATLAFPRGLAVHADAPNELPNLYISDVDNHAIRRVDGVTKIISTVAGTGLEDCATLEGIPDPPPCSPLGDGGPAKQAAVSFPNGVAFDDYGNLFISEIYGRVRKVKNGIISTVGGVGPGLHGKKGPLSKLQLVPNPHDPTFDPQGNLFLCDTDNHRVYRFNAINGEVTAESTVTPVAGSGFMDGVGAGYYSLSDIGNRATQASVDRPTGLAEHAGRLYLVQESGVIRYVEGGGNGLVDGGGDEKIFDIGALGGLKEIFGIAAYGGDVFATEIRTGRIRRVDGAGQLSTAAGTAVQAFSIDGPGKDLSDDPGVALLAGDAVFGQLLRLGFDAAGNLYVTDWYAILGLAGSVRRIQAGGGPIGPSSPIETLIELPFVPVGIAVESENRQYISDPVGLRIWAIENNNGLVTLNPIAGTGAFGHTGDDGPALNADIGTVYGLALDETQEHLYFGERDFGAIRRVNLSTGVISTVFVLDSPDGECCPAAPSDLVVSGNNLYVVDVAYSRIFRIDLSTFDSTLIAGGNSGVFNGDGIATEVNLDNPVAIASDPQQGILYTGEGHGQRIRRLEVEKK